MYIIKGGTWMQLVAYSLYSEYYFSIDNLCKDMFLRSQVIWQQDEG